MNKRPGPVPVSPEVRFWPKVNKTESCWLWIGSNNGIGYGKFWDGKRSVYAHRFAWELLRGPIPDGYVLDHDNPEFGCRQRNCVNPDHLEVVTQRRNVERATASTRNKSGVRGVSWIAERRKWLARVQRFGVIHEAGAFDTVAEAELAVIALRTKLDAVVG